MEREFGDIENISKEEGKEEWREGEHEYMRLEGEVKNEGGKEGK